MEVSYNQIKPLDGLRVQGSSFLAIGLCKRTDTQNYIIIA